MTGVMNLVAGAPGAQTVCFCYYGQMFGDMIKSHNRTLVGQASTQLYMVSFWPYPFRVCVATLIYVFGTNISMMVGSRTKSHNIILNRHENKEPRQTGNALRCHSRFVWHP